MCRESWACTNESNLVSYIKEYTDHNMLKKRVGPGGTECHYCTLSREVMERLAPPRDEHVGTSLCRDARHVFRVLVQG